MSTPFQHRPGKSDRQVGDAPSIGHVPRMHKESESRAGRYKPRRTSAGHSGAGLDMKTALRAGALVLAAGVIIIGLFAWITSSRRSDAEQGLATAPPAVPHLAATPRITAPDDAALKQLVKEFLEAGSPEELAPLIRPIGDRDRASLFTGLTEILKADGAVTSIQYIGPMDSRALPLEALVVNFTGDGAGTGRRNRLALLSPDAEGRWQVDYDAFVRHVSTPWPVLLSGKADSGVVRVFVSPDSYYNGVYRDDARWVCFGMASPDEEMLMFGYVPRDSIQFEVLKLISADAEVRAPGSDLRAKRLTLEIQHDPEAEPRQFQITRVLSDEWAAGAEALDEKLSRPLSAGVK